MKKFLIILILATSHFKAKKANCLHDWETFKVTFNKTYPTEREEKNREEIFLKNVQLIQNHNQKYQKGLTSYSVEVNKFADSTFEELFTSFKTNGTPRTKSTKAVPKASPPDSIDWRDYGVITPVGDQGYCFTCWAFAVVGALEAHVGIHLNFKNQSLSPQNLADCVYDNFQCKEEMVRTALDDCYRYILEHGIDTELSYPYEDQTGNGCRYSPEHVGARIKGYATVAEGDEEEMKAVVGTIGPVSVLITADLTFTFYRSGVYYKENWEESKDLFNHAVTVVGYGSEDGEDYWLVKNEWSEVFGDHGYIKMARNRDNNCGIASYAKYPIL